jgi:hypothetical protein
MGLLAGLEDGGGFELRECEHLVGTSAGSIVAAHLVGGDGRRRPSTLSTEIEISSAQPAGRLAVAAVAAARRAGSMALAASHVRAARARDRGAWRRAAAGRASTTAAEAARDARGAPPPRRALERALRRSAAGRRRRSPLGPSDGVRQAGRAKGDGRRGGRGFVHRPVAVRAGRDPGPRIRRRRRVESNEPCLPSTIELASRPMVVASMIS